MQNLWHFNYFTLDQEMRGDKDMLPHVEVNVEIKMVQELT